MFKVKKRTLQLIAGIVWLIAGFNAAGIGVLSYFEIDFFDLKSYIIMIYKKMVDYLKKALIYGHTSRISS